MAPSYDAYFDSHLCLCTFATQYFDIWWSTGKGHLGEGSMKPEHLNCFDAFAIPDIPAAHDTDRLSDAENLY